MSATAPDMPACQRKGFVYRLKDTTRLTWASVAAQAQREKEKQG